MAGMRGDFGLPGYQVEGLLGAGPTGEVWLAVEQASREQVALKRLRLDPADGPDAIRRLVATLSSIGHEHLLPIRRVAEDGGEPVLVCEYAVSGSLGQLLNAREHLDPGETVTAIGPVAEALAAVHARGLVHGDVTPENILFTADGRPLLADTGLLALTPATEAATGTHGYTDPRVIAGAEPSRPADVYGLAAAAWAALTGSAPPPSGRPSLLSESPGVPPGLAHAIESGLQAEPDVRPSAEQLAEMVYAAAQPAAVRFPVGLVITEPSETGPAAPGSDGTSGSGGGRGRIPQWGRDGDRTGRSRPADTPPAPTEPDHADGPAASLRPTRAAPPEDTDDGEDLDDEDDERGRNRLLYPALIGAAAIVVAAALVVGGIAVFGDRGSEPVADPTSAATTSAPTPDHRTTARPSPTFTPPRSGAAAFGTWGKVFDRLLAARAKALFDADPSELDAAFTADSTIRAHDAEQIRTWLGDGKRVSGFTLKVSKLNVESATKSTVTLTATTHVEPYQVIDADGNVVRRFAASKPVTDKVVLHKNNAGRWRIYSW